VPPKPPDLAFDTLAAAFRATSARVPADRIALRSHDGTLAITWRQYAQWTAAVAAGLAGLARDGLTRPGTVGLLLPNVPFFHVVDAAAGQLGLTTCSLYPTLPPHEARFIVDDADCRVLVTCAANLGLAQHLAAECRGLTRVLVVDARAGELPAGVSTVPGLTEEERDAAPALDRVAARLTPEDTLSLVYTSGTTGPPKGVQITNRNVLAVARGFFERLPLPDGCRLVSYLPMAHVAERAASHWMPMVLGASVTCCPDQRLLAQVLPSCRPQWFFGVPRVWEKLQAAIREGVAAAPPAMRAVIEEALSLGEVITAAREGGAPPPAQALARYEILSGQVLKPVRELAGLDDLVAAHSGAAPVARRVLAFFHALGVPVGQIWGMTELGAAACVSVPGRVRLDTVGPPLDGVEVTIAGDGEVLVRGDLVMAGYRNRPEETAATVDPQGWLHSGDLGERRPDGELVIVGRAKEILINSYGKNMSPAKIEAVIKAEVPLISQVCCVGEGRPYNVALATLDQAATPELLTAVVAGVRAANERLASVERVRRIHVLPDDWSPGSEEVTPSLKLRRAVITKKYQDEIEALYSQAIGHPC